MPSPFESVARVAIDEIVKKHLVPSKFGYFLNNENLQALNDEILEFLQTSRTLRDAGDRYIANQQKATARAQAASNPRLSQPPRR